jgi:hypothetical protein
MIPPKLSRSVGCPRTRRYKNNNEELVGSMYAKDVEKRPSYEDLQRA